MVSKKRIVLHLNAKVKITEASEKDKLTVSLKYKSNIKRECLTGNDSMKKEIKEDWKQRQTKLCAIGSLVLWPQKCILTNVATESNQMTDKLEKTDFMASNRWLESFRRRHSIFFFNSV
jgi:hypothetical protein